MPALQDITESLVRDNITRAVLDVFKTMLGRAAQLCPNSPQGSLTSLPSHANPSLSGVPLVVGTVGFIGEANGLIYLYFDQAFARVCTCQLLGMTEADLDEAGDEVINDAIGEMTNMTVGSFKNGLCDAGYPCKLTIPSILRGSNFSIEPISSAQRHIFRFESGGHRLVTDILMKVGE
ncbi:MAG TPA: chemotaxis protein CheX [Opitutaceae bacterium]|nr:chemotaxis protein CheX [Opitutaceae bacterium]